MKKKKNLGDLFLFLILPCKCHSQNIFINNSKNINNFDVFPNQKITSKVRIPSANVS